MTPQKCSSRRSSLVGIDPDSYEDERYTHSISIEFYIWRIVGDGLIRLNIFPDPFPPLPDSWRIRRLLDENLAMMVTRWVRLFSVLGSRSSTAANRCSAVHIAGPRLLCIASHLSVVLSEGRPDFLCPTSDRPSQKFGGLYRFGERKCTTRPLLHKLEGFIVSRRDPKTVLVYDDLRSDVEASSVQNIPISALHLEGDALCKRRGGRQSGKGISTSPGRGTVTTVLCSSSPRGEYSAKPWIRPHTLDCLRGQGRVVIILTGILHEDIFVSRTASLELTVQQNSLSVSLFVSSHLF